MIPSAPATNGTARSIVGVSAPAGDVVLTLLLSCDSFVRHASNHGRPCVVPGSPVRNCTWSSRPVLYWPPMQTTGKTRRRNRRPYHSRLTASSNAARRLRHAHVDCRIARQARVRCVFARQPGQHQRVVGPPEPEAYLVPAWGSPLTAAAGLGLA